MYDYKYKIFKGNQLIDFENWYDIFFDFDKLTGKNDYINLLKWLEDNEYSIHAMATESMITNIQDYKKIMEIGKTYYDRKATRDATITIKFGRKNF